MKITNLHKNQHGIAHLGLILLVVAVLGVVFFAYTRVNDANKPSDSPSQSATSVENEDSETNDAKALNKADEEAQKTSDQVSGQEETENVAQ